METTLSPLGWTLIIFLSLFIVVINVSLFTKLRRRPTRNNWVEKITNAGKTIRDPFRNENEKWKELSEKVNTMQKNSANPDDQSGQVNIIGEKNDQ